jgi:DNA mismatch repair protein MSH2
MSEMLEASCMLKTATKRSLIIIDELGRGTSTSEGFGIAWAIAEHIAIELQSWCLFATHFHEMTMMQGQVPGAKNYYVSCLTDDNKITMQYKLREGAVDRSYGLMVAQMLNFPQEVLDDARRKAAELESFNLNTITNSAIEEEVDFNTIEEEIQHYARRSSIHQKEAIIKLSERKLPTQ